jgi:hypothetical protein
MFALGGAPGEGGDDDDDEGGDGGGKRQRTSSGDDASTPAAPPAAAAAAAAAAVAERAAAAAARVAAVTAHEDEPEHALPPYDTRTFGGNLNLSAVELIRQRAAAAAGAAGAAAGFTPAPQQPPGFQSSLHNLPVKGHGPGRMAAHTNMNGVNQPAPGK